MRYGMAWCRVLQTEVLHPHPQYLPPTWRVLTHVFSLGRVFPGMAYLALVMVSHCYLMAPRRVMVCACSASVSRRLGQPRWCTSSFPTNSLVGMSSLGLTALGFVSDPKFFKGIWMECRYQEHTT